MVLKVCSDWNSTLMNLRAPEAGTPVIEVAGEADGVDEGDGDGDCSSSAVPAATANAPTLPTIDTVRRLGREVDRTGDDELVCDELVPAVLGTRSLASKRLRRFLTFTV
jgi:hypothetical protein